jgi:hypothetical protein
MKQHSILLASAMLLAAHAHAQQAFTRVTMQTSNNRTTISFTLPSEANVYQYRIEGSNDSASYEVLGTVKPSGNSVMAITYSYDLYDLDWKYYRIGKVGMNASQQYSAVITAKPGVAPPAIPVHKLPAPQGNSPIATRKVTKSDSLVTGMK